MPFLFTDGLLAKSQLRNWIAAGCSRGWQRRSNIQWVDDALLCRSVTFSSNWLVSSRAGSAIPPPKSMLVVKKRNDKLVDEALVYFLDHVRKFYPRTQLYFPSPTGAPEYLDIWDLKKHGPIDLVVTFGGDGTILRANALFRTGRIPPVLSFSMGNLGFLLPFHIDSFPKVLARIYEGRATIMERMRLACTFLDADDRRVDDCGQLAECGEEGWQVMNEVTLHRGRSPHLNRIDAYVDDTHLTEAVSDGLIVGTPTGSTAYSLSSGGPIVHPMVRTILLTPICPRSLSFRPLLLPGSSDVQLRVHANSRAPAEVSMDGQEARTLHPGESVKIHVSRWPVPCIERWSPSDIAVIPAEVEKRHHIDASGLMEDPHERGRIIDQKRDNGSDEWVRDINTLLQFNAAFRNKALLRHSHL